MHLERVVGKKKQKELFASPCFCYLGFRNSAKLRLPEKIIMNLLFG